jgi:hypothetical protein
MVETRSSRAANREHTKEFTITLRVLADRDATLDGMKAFIDDIEWVGGWRPPDDPLFTSVTIISKSVGYARKVKEHA